MVLLGYNGFYWIKMGSLRFKLVLLGKKWVLLGCNSFYWVKIGSDRLKLVLLS